MGRTYALERLNDGESVVFDPNGIATAALIFLPLNCPS
jgi:hypothetical protein